MKTLTLTLEIDVKGDDPALLDKIAGRAYTIDGVEDVRVVQTGSVYDRVADAVLKFKPAFGEDTVQSFATFIRGLK